MRFYVVRTVKHLVTDAGCDLEVSQRRDDGCDVAEHAAHPQQQEHEEVEHGPELRQRHVLNGFTIDDEGQAGALHSLKPR